MEAENKNGIFGPIYDQFCGQPKLAIKHLLKMQNGECPKALCRDDIGYIDIVWGENNPKTNKGFGLKHIVEKHGASIKELGFEVEDFIPIVVQFGNLSVKKSDDKKLILESETFRIVIQTRWDNQEKIFLLTAFDQKKSPSKSGYFLKPSGLHSLMILR